MKSLSKSSLPNDKIIEKKNTKPDDVRQYSFVAGRRGFKSETIVCIQPHDCLLAASKSLQTANM